MSAITEVFTSGLKIIQRGESKALPSVMEYWNKLAEFAGLKTHDAIIEATNKADSFIKLTGDQEKAAKELKDTGILSRFFMMIKYAFRKLFGRAGKDLVAENKVGELTHNDFVKGKIFSVLHPSDQTLMNQLKKTYPGLIKFSGEENKAIQIHLGGENTNHVYQLNDIRMLLEKKVPLDELSKVEKPFTKEQIKILVDQLSTKEHTVEEILEFINNPSQIKLTEAIKTMKLGSAKKLGERLSLAEKDVNNIKTLLKMEKLTNAERKILAETFPGYTFLSDTEKTQFDSIKPNIFTARPHENLASFQANLSDYEVRIKAAFEDQHSAKEYLDLLNQLVSYTTTKS